MIGVWFYPIQMCMENNINTQFKVVAWNIRSLGKKLSRMKSGI